MSTPDDVRGLFEAGRFREAHAAAVDALAAAPEDVELLRIAGRASVEAGGDDAVDLLRRVADLRPDEPQSWRDLGDALATEGRTDEAGEAFKRAVDLDPADERSLTSLGHATFAPGREAEAVSFLEQAAERSEGMSSATISLVDMYRQVGELDAALGAARQVADAQPGDVLAALDVAELNLDLGRPEEAAAAFERVRMIDELPDHEVYALHGMIRTEIERERWDRALELAREAEALDRYGRTVALLAFLEAQVSGPGEEPPPTRDEVDAALRDSLAAHRRAHAEDRGLAEEDELLG
jgi:Flp pilus assembly protein TadD